MKLWLNRITVKKTKIIAVIIFYALSIQLMHAQEPSDFKRGAIKSRLSVAPVMSFYKNHPEHTVETKAKGGFCASYKSEILLGRNLSFLVGIEYFNQGLTFRGYYSAPSNTYLYDRTFPYSHELRMQEIQLPIGLKKAFNNEKDNFYTPYYFGGVGARYLFKSYYVIINDSTENVVYDGKGSMEFEHHVVAKAINAFAYGGLGAQYNLRASAKAIFIDVTYKYGISRLHYKGYQKSNNLNIKEAHVSFSIGLKF